MATSSTKKLILLVAVLLSISISLFFYAIFNQNIRTENLPTNPEKLDFYEFSALLATDDYSSLAILAGTIDLTGQFQNFANVTTIKNNRITFENQNKKNYYAEYAEPIVLEGAFRILLNFDSHNTNSSIILSGREGSQDSEWWQDVIRVYIGYNKDEDKNYLSINNGQQEQSVYYYLFEKKTKNQSIILEFADQIGSVMIIKNSVGQYLADVNLTADKELGLENGLFPYSSMKIGISLPPDNGRLKINQLLFFQI